MTRAPEDEQPEGAGGDAAERLRQHLRARFTQDTADAMDPDPDDDAPARHPEPGDGRPDGPAPAAGEEPGAGD